MPHNLDLIFTLTGGFTAALILGYLTQRIRLSPLVGYLLAGIIVGPFSPGFVAHAALAEQLAELGVILLMFGVGLHFHVKDLLAVRRIAVPGALVQIAVATALGVLITRLVGWSLSAGVVFGLAIAVASTVVLLRVLADYDVLHTSAGHVAVGWLLVEDVFTVLVLVLLPIVTGPSTGGALSIVTSVGVAILKVAALVVFTLVVGRRTLPYLLGQVAKTRSRELFTLTVLVLALGIAVGSATLFGASMALGAFLAGMVVGQSEFSSRAASEALPMRDAFAVLFFVSVGMLFNPHILIEQPLPVLATFVTIVGGKSLVSFLIVRAFGHPTSTALTIATSLAQIGEFSFILAGLAVALKLLPPEGRDLILAGSILSIIANPLLFVALGRWQRARAAASAPPVANPIARGPPIPAAGHTIVIGYGRVGHQLAKILSDRGIAVVVIDNDRELVEKAHRDGLAAVRGNAAASGRLDALMPATATHALVAIPQAFEAGEIIARLRAAKTDTMISDISGSAAIRRSMAGRATSITRAGLAKRIV